MKNQNQPDKLTDKVIPSKELEAVKTNISTTELAGALVNILRGLENIELASKPYKDYLIIISQYQNLLQGIGNVVSILNKNKFIKSE